MITEDVFIIRACNILMVMSEIPLFESNKAIDVIEIIGKFIMVFHAKLFLNATGTAVCNDIINLVSGFFKVI